MPGISFIYDSKEDLTDKSESISLALDSIIHYDRYYKKILCSEKSYFLGCTAYDEYPVRSFENDHFLIFIEGMIYNLPCNVLNKELTTLAQIISSSNNDKKNKIKKWLLSIDGDFVIFILNKRTNAIYILNDILGRLPVYLYNNDGKMIISRELRFIANYIKNIVFDRMAITQILLLGFPIGKRTLLEKINRLEPSSLIEIDCNSSEIKKESLHEFNFEIKDNRDKPIEENVEALVSLFSETCRGMASVATDYENVVALSGGLDSRAIVAALNRNNCRYKCVTRMSYDNRELADAELAMQVARLFHVDWKELHSVPPNGKDMLNLLRTKNGMNSLNVGLFMPYLNNILDQYGAKIIYFTGEDGNYRLPDCSPTRKLTNVNDIIQYIMENEERWPIDNIALITNIDKKEIMHEIEERLLSYPEKDCNQKLIHFGNSVKSPNRNFESEDRNRFFFWSVSPYSSVRFYNYALNCPDEQKVNHQLHRKFLMQLSPEAAKIINKDWGVSITTNNVSRKSFKSLIRSKVPRSVKDKMKIYFRKDTYGQDAMILRCLQYQLDTCDEIYNYMSKKTLKASLRNLTKVQVNNLFTITSIIEDLTSTESVLEKYYQSDFI